MRTRGSVHDARVPLAYIYTDLGNPFRAFWNRVELFDLLAQFLQDKKVIIAGGHWDRLKHHD
ncbi:hypothetical protein EI981_23465 [Paenibacillus lutimineralis]|uniref:Uncharacterized protein n=2 Tax=Paenibacillus lutimineralis TaxID=2707005 RepID=A0A3Q9IBL3_9BACL|nr:hypothetical protein EI981_23465 [Paenibacillus lutimineralis]